MESKELRNRLENIERKIDQLFIAFVDLQNNIGDIVREQEPLEESEQEELNEEEILNDKPTRVKEK